jgi:hypothetical protein
MNKNPFTIISKKTLDNSQHTDNLTGGNEEAMCCLSFSPIGANSVISCSMPERLGSLLKYYYHKAV